MGYAKITVIGNLGRDPELRYTPNGRPICSFSVAVGHSKPDGQGGWTDEHTDWFNVSVWGEQGERWAERLHKGSKVLVEGRFTQRSYTRNDNTTGNSLDISADSVVDISGKRDESAPSSPTPTGPNDDIDELPF